MKPVLTLRQTQCLQGVISYCKLISYLHTSKRLHGYNCNRNQSSVFWMIAERRTSSSFNEQFLCYFYPYLKDYEQILWNVQTFYLYLQPKMI